MFVPTSKPTVPPIEWRHFLPRLAAMFLLVLASFLFFHLAKGRPFGSAANESLVQGLLMTAGMTFFGIWQRRDRYRGADPGLSMVQRVQALAASQRGPLPADKSVQREALRLARLSHEAAIRGIAVQAILGVGAFVLALLALLTSPWWWGDSAVAASLAGLLMWDLRRSRSRALLLMTAPLKSQHA